METLSVSGLSIEIIRKDIKNIHLRVYPPEGFVRISVPKEMTSEAIRLFVIQKIGWIRRQQKAFLETERISPREFLDRESHYFMGERYLLRVVEEIAPPKVIVRNKTYLEVHVRPTTGKEKFQEVLTEWYRQELKQVIPEFITKWEPVLGVSVEEWYVKQMRTRWGTCNPDKKRLWLNLELAKKPPRCIEYIVVHEMVHLLERTHNERFLQLMDSYLPNWQVLRRELNSLPVSHAEWNY